MKISKITDKEFYTGDTISVAKNLLGKYLVRRYGGELLVGKIVETEAYKGPEDEGAHTHKGKRTKRTEAMFSRGGHVYVYLIYGMYWMFNISTAGKDKPEAVLVRALEPVLVKEEKPPETLANGPGKLCRYMHIDKTLYGEDLTTSESIWIEDRREPIKKKDIVATTRVGIEYAGEKWKNKRWRFYIKNNSYISKP